MTPRRQRLLERLDTTWSAFQDSYAGLPEAVLLEPGVTKAWSVKDIIAHVTTWEEEALKHLPDVLEGRRPPRYSVVYGGIDAFNALHQDLYGEHVFPLQVAILLSEPDTDFTGGEFVLTEQRPRMQSRAEVVPLEQGDCVIFPVRHRPVRGTRGSYRVTMRHGVSRLRSGHRHTLGIIFHDAR